MFNRRSFLFTAAASGLAVLSPHMRTSQAGPATYPGPYWVFVNASGGWDPTYFCDPKGGVAGNKESVNQLYAPGSAKKAGENILYAPVAGKLDDYDFEIFSNERFFNAHANRFLVLNGVDTTTNNHDAGSRIVWSGELTEGHPCLGALAAAVATEKNPLSLPFISYGGYDATANLVAPTRTGSVDSLRRLAYADRSDPAKPETSYHTGATISRIETAQRDRLTAMLDAQKLPVARGAMSSLLLSRNTDDALSLLADKLQTEKPVSADDFDDLKTIPKDKRYPISDLMSLMQQAQLGVLAFQAGVAVSMSMNLGGFDTHDTHDRRQVPQIMKLLRGIDYLIEKAKVAGIADKMYIVVGSDFGRTPFYNGGNGKDHWNITSMLVSGPGIRGGRTIGETDDGFKAKMLDPTTLKPSESGIKLQPQHVHHALRKAAGLDASALTQKFPLAQDPIPLFG